MSNIGAAERMGRFKKATKKQARGRIALMGPSGSGKTYTALRLARELGTRIALIDTERGSASKYAGEQIVAGRPERFEFDALDLESFAPSEYVRAIKDAEAEGYDVLVIDSLSHAWMGKDGVLEMAEKAGARNRGGNTFANWREVTPEHNDLVEAILQSRCHIIVTMRVKTEWVMEKDERGKTVPKKVGLEPVQKKGLEYEFDLVVDLDQENNFVVTKSRCAALNKYVAREAGEKEGKALAAWLSEGTEAPTMPAPPPVEPPPRTPEFTRLSTTQITDPEAWRTEVAAARKEGTITAEEYKELGVIYARAKKQ